MAESNVISLKGIRDFKSVQELKEYTKAQYNTILALTSQLQEANTKVKHLEGLLQNNSPILKIDSETFKNKNTGEILCELEIEKIFAKAQVTELSLEETKRLDLLMKNLYLAREKIKKEEPKDVINTATDEELLQLASKSSNE